MDRAFKSALEEYIRGYISYITKVNLDLSDEESVEDVAISVLRLYGALRDYQSKYLIRD